MAKAISYRIYPSIGIARLGSSDGDYFIGPEVPGAVPKGPFRTAGKIKSQGARFRIYEFECDEFGNETCKREIIADDNTKIQWKIRLVNSKAATREFPPYNSDGTESNFRNRDYERGYLVIDTDEQSIGGTGQAVGPVSGGIKFIKQGIEEGSAQVELGYLKTDKKGRLIVVGANGKSASPVRARLRGFANNDGWYDNVSDGPVKAFITIGNGEPIEVQGQAWVVIAPPSYAPGIDNVTTWYDQALNVDVNYFNPVLMTLTPSFTRDIYPILKRTVLLQWVSEYARSWHGNREKGDYLKTDLFDKLKDNSDSSKEARKKIFTFLVPPNIEAKNAQNLPNGTTLPGDHSWEDKPMPMLYSGVNPINPEKYVFSALTGHQYSIMLKWSEGKFDSDWNGEPAIPNFDDIPLNEKPATLTRAALEACIGGPFYPGIEATYIIAQRETYESPYRISHDKSPGFLTTIMALPWQADFIACGALWWPAQRPVSVKTESGNYDDFTRGINNYAGMVENWSELGFIFEDGSEYIEKERGNVQ